MAAATRAAGVGARSCGIRPAPGLADGAQHGGADGLADRAVPGAAAQVALHAAVEVVEVVGAQGGCRDAHPRGAEAALEPEARRDRLLNRVQVVTGREARGRGDRATLQTHRGHDARVRGGAVEQHGAGAAVSGVAALLDLDVTRLAQQRAGALAGPRFRLDGGAVDGEPHAVASSDRRGAGSPPRERMPRRCRAPEDAPASPPHPRRDAADVRGSPERGTRAPALTPHPAASGDG